MRDSTLLIRVQGLTHAYGEGVLRREVLHDVSLDFLAGEITIIVGPSGSGKTTLLSLIGALRAVQTGNIQILQYWLQGASAEELVEVRRHIGFIFQSHNLIPSLTALENVQLALAVDAQENPFESAAKARAALSAVGLEDFLHRRPAQLSGGQRQRVAIARALVRRPRILLADEPTASLDKQTGREIVQLLENLARRMGCAVIIVTHDNRILDTSDRVISLEDGYAEETHLGLNRLVQEIVQLFESLLSFFELTRQPEAVNQQLVWSKTVYVRSDKVSNALSALQYLRVRAELAQQLEAMGSVLSQVRSLVETMVRMGELVSAKSTDPLERITDQFLQAGEAVFLTAVEALNSHASEDLRVLLQITEDRREAMQRIRHQYFTAQNSLDENGRNHLFDLTNSFARMIFFLHQIAREWETASGMNPGREKTDPKN